MLIISVSLVIGIGFSYIFTDTAISYVAKYVGQNQADLVASNMNTLAFGAGCLVAILILNMGAVFMIMGKDDAARLLINVLSLATMPFGFLLGGAGIFFALETGLAELSTLVS